MTQAKRVRLLWLKSLAIELGLPGIKVSMNCESIKKHGNQEVCKCVSVLPLC